MILPLKLDGMDHIASKNTKKQEQQHNADFILHKIPPSILFHSKTLQNQIISKTDLPRNYISPTLSNIKTYTNLDTSTIIKMLRSMDVPTLIKASYISDIYNLQIISNTVQYDLRLKLKKILDAKNYKQHEDTHSHDIFRQPIPKTISQLINPLAQLIRTYLSQGPHALGPLYKELTPECCSTILIAADYLAICIDKQNTFINTLITYLAFRLTEDLTKTSSLSTLINTYRLKTIGNRRLNETVNAISTIINLKGIILTNFDPKQKRMTPNSTNKTSSISESHKLHVEKLLNHMGAEEKLEIMYQYKRNNIVPTISRLDTIVKTTHSK